MLLLLDNHDSFTYNLAALLQSLGQTVLVRQPEAITVAEVVQGPWNAVIISPGPGHPAQAPCKLHVEALLKQRLSLPILGICLGHQLLALLHGGRIRLGNAPVHGHVHPVHHTRSGVFIDLPDEVRVMRYHSLSVDAGTLGADWVVDAWTTDAEQAVMAIRHRSQPLDGLQFHPESIGTPLGAAMLRSWLAQRFEVQRAKSGQELASLPVLG